MNKEKIILFGGSFDPPHLGHLVVGQWVAEALGGKVRFLPAGAPPHKNPFSIGENRLAMLKIALRDNPLFLIDEYEYNLGKVNFTVETLARYQRNFGVAREDLYFVLGSDSLRDLPAWRDPPGIAARATLAVFPRETVDWKELLAPLGPLKAKVIICNGPIISISSTLIRERVKMGLSIRYLVPRAVEKFIGEKGLYQEGN